MERRVGTPGALPVRILVPSGVAELPCTHDLGADPRTVLAGEDVVNAAATAGLPPPSGEQPFVQPVAGVTEMGVFALSLTGTPVPKPSSEMEKLWTRKSDMLMLLRWWSVGFLWCS
jgi:hypothetical protein